jgi:hypothetical protein
VVTVHDHCESLLGHVERTAGQANTAVPPMEPEGFELSATL